MKKGKVLLIISILILSLLLSSCTASSPYIGENGNWWIGSEDTGVSATGPKGDTGDQGPAGADGASGIAGADGKSAYEIYCEKYGYNKSEEDWLREINEALSRTNTEDIYRIASLSTVIIEAVNKKGEKFSTGSGFIISADGLIATAHHVIEKAYALCITLPDGRVTNASSIVGFDEGRDIALIRVAAEEPLEFLEIETDPVIPGEEAFSYGIPLGFLDGSFSSGVVSSNLRDVAIDELSDESYKVVQFTAPISSGNSGGPLLNSHGKVIGVITSKYVYGEALNIATYIEELANIDTSYERSVADFYADTVYYQVKFGELDYDESENNGGADSANETDNGHTVYGTTSYRDYDIFTFTVRGTESARVTIAYVTAENLNVLFAGEDLTAVSLEWNSASYSGYNVVYATLTLAPGTYYIQISGGSLYQSTYGLYTYWRTSAEYESFPYEIVETDFLP